MFLFIPNGSTELNEINILRPLFLCFEPPRRNGYIRSKSIPYPGSNLCPFDGISWNRMPGGRGYRDRRPSRRRLRRRHRGLSNQAEGHFFVRSPPLSPFAGANPRDIPPESGGVRTQECPYGTNNGERSTVSHSPREWEMSSPPASKRQRGLVQQAPHVFCTGSTLISFRWSESERVPSGGR